MFFHKKDNKQETHMHESQHLVGSQLSFGASEAYKLLRTNLMFSLPDDGKCKIIGVTSALRGEGKSTTSSNLAYTLAEAGKKTLLIDSDMRLPVMEGIFKLNKGPGLSNVLTGLSTLEEALRLSVMKEKLCVLPAGEIPPNPSELLSSKRMEDVMGSLAQQFDYIIVDLPPISAVSDSLAVAKLLTGMIIVVRQDYCDQSSLSSAMRQLAFLHVKVLGFVMSDAKTSKNGYYKKYYKAENS